MKTAIAGRKRFDERNESIKILVLNGSPRPNGNTAGMVKVFNVCKMNIKGCLACEYCHGKGHGQCVQKDDMQEIYAELRNTEMLVLAAPIYYHGISGQLKCVIDRFYSALYPTAPAVPIEKLIFFRLGRLTCKILDQPNKDDFVRKYIRKDIKCKLTSFRIIFIL